MDLAKTQAALAGMPELAFAVVKRTTGAETTQQLDAKFAACMTQLLPALAIK